MGADLAGVALAADGLLARGDAGAVDGQALLAVGGAGLDEAGGDALVRGHVHLAEDAADFLGDLLAALFVQVEQGDLDALGRQRPRRAFAQARSPARHHRRNRTVEFHEDRPYIL
ncbi:hypothetical protein D3C86_1616130 [compost metagenome]